MRSSDNVQNDRLANLTSVNVLQAGLGLGVEQMTTLQFLRTYLCTATASLPAGPRDAAFLRMLEDLPRLRRIDSTIVDELRTVCPSSLCSRPVGPHLYDCSPFMVLVGIWSFH